MDNLKKEKVFLNQLLFMNTFEMYIVHKIFKYYMQI